MEKVLSTMLQEIKSALKLTQPMLAEALGVKVDRVKSLTSGKVAKLTQAETKSLVENLHVNPGWLATGEGEMLLSAAEQAFSSNLSALRKTTDAVTGLSISDERKRQVRDIMFAVASGKADLIERAFALEAGTTDKAGETRVMYMAGGKTDESTSGLSIDESMLAACHAACRHVHGESFDAQPATVQISYAVDLYNQSIKISSQNGGLEEMHRLERDGMAKLLELLIRLRWVKHFPPNNDGWNFF